MQGFARSKFRIHDFLDSAKKSDGLLLLNLPCLQHIGECRQLLTHTFMFHHHSVQLALKSANEQFRLRIVSTIPRIRITVTTVGRLLGGIIGDDVRTDHIRIHGLTAKAGTSEREAKESSDAHKATYDPRPATSVRHAFRTRMNTRKFASALFFTYVQSNRYHHERWLTGERGLSDLERERSLIIASVHAHCDPRAECLGRRRLLGKAALLRGSISRVVGPRDISRFNWADALLFFRTSGKIFGRDGIAASSGSDGVTWCIVPDDQTTTTGEAEEAGEEDGKDGGEEDDATGREAEQGTDGEKEERGKEGGGKGGGGRGGGERGGGKGGGGRGGKGREEGGGERGGGRGEEGEEKGDERGKGKEGERRGGEEGKEGGGKEEEEERRQGEPTGTVESISPGTAKAELLGTLDNRRCLAIAASASARIRCFNSRHSSRAFDGSVSIRKSAFACSTLRASTSSRHGGSRSAIL